MTALQELVREWLGEDPVPWINARRAAGTSWDLVAVDLYDTTRRRRWIPPETLRTWVRDAPASTDRSET